MQRGSMYHRSPTLFSTNRILHVDNVTQSQTRRVYSTRKTHVATLLPSAWRDSGTQAGLQSVVICLDPGVLDSP